MEIVRVYSDDPADWEEVAEFLVGFLLRLAQKEKAPGLPGAG